MVTAMLSATAMVLVMLLTIGTMVATLTIAVLGGAMAMALAMTITMVMAMASAVASEWLLPMDTAHAHAHAHGHRADRVHGHIRSKHISLASSTDRQHAMSVASAFIKHHALIMQNDARQYPSRKFKQGVSLAKMELWAPLLSCLLTATSKLLQSSGEKALKDADAHMKGILSFAAQKRGNGSTCG